MSASPSPSPELEISIGSVLDGRYRIDAILGAGGMGRVYRAEHTGIGRPVAIKVLHADLNRNREAAQRFQREAIASGAGSIIKHRQRQRFRHRRRWPCYLVMEVLEGRSLGARLRARAAGAVARGDPRSSAACCSGSATHERGVVHRDIKPDNVFLTRKDGDLVVKILDFGIAKLFAGNADDPASTRAGITVGTPAYLSPEQAVGGEIKPASDLYSATIPPVRDDLRVARRSRTRIRSPCSAHVSREPPRIGEVAPDIAVPGALEEVIQRGLIKTSADRIGTADAYLAELDAVLASTPARGAPYISQHIPEALGSAPTAMLSTTTPAPGTLSPLTPMPGGNDTMILLTDRKDGPALPAVTRAISLSDAPPIPRNWIRIGAIVVALAAVIALVAAIATSGSKTEVLAGRAHPGPSRRSQARARSQTCSREARASPRPRARCRPAPARAHRRSRRQAEGAAPRSRRR
ncbi:MAG: serine/threonine protein kinase [Myxococcales bacterium]|nr:serine/threonine protein kinase [Myxococcales bacterium]